MTSPRHRNGVPPHAHFPAGLVLLLVALTLLGATQVAVRPRIGVVDLDRVFDQHPGKAELEKELGGMREALQKRLAKLEESAAAVRSQLDLVEKGTKRYRELERELLRIGGDLRFEQTRSADDFAERKREYRDRLLREIRKTIDRIGAERGLELILQRQFKVSEESLSWTSVLYADPAADLTGTVLEVLSQ